MAHVDGVYSQSCFVCQHFSANLKSMPKFFTSKYLANKKVSQSRVFSQLR